MVDLLFLELSVVIITAGVISLIAYALKQPLIIAYMLTGLIVGPSLFGVLQSSEAFHSLAQIGIAFLLFLVGLNLNWHHIKDVGRIALLAGVGQVVFTTLLGFLIALAFGYDVTTGILLGLALALSSTIVIVKVLSDKEDIERFYGRITIGILIVQDFVAMFVLLWISAVGTGGDMVSVASIAIIKGVLAVVLLWAAAKYILPHLFRYAAHSQELLFVTAISWCFAVASGLHLLGFGIEIGALFAGIALAGTGFQREIGKKIIPLRDFFVVIFFIVLGTNLTLDSLDTILLPAIAFSVFVLIGNPIIVMLILRAFNYHPRTGFLVGTSLAQVSEFSFIIIASAIAVGIVDESLLPMVTIVGMITIGVSSYLMSFNEDIYEKSSFLMKWLIPKVEFKKEKRKEIIPIIIFGYHRIGASIIETVEKMKTKYVVVDFDPSAIEEMDYRNIPHRYGDAGNEEFLKDLRADKSKLVISTIPDENVNKDILRFMKSRKAKTSVILTAKTSADAAKLYELGATFVIIPNVLGGKMFAQILKKSKISKTNWKLVGKKNQH